MKINFDGLENFQKNLSKLQENAESLDGKHDVPILDLFTEDFMINHTEFKSIEEMFSEGNIDFNSEKNADLDTDKSWNTFVSKHTDFKDWNSMLEKAAEYWVSKKLGI